MADFVGSSNVLEPGFTAATGGPAKWASLRPEKIGVTARQAEARRAAGAIAATVASVHYQGAVTRLHARTTAGQTLNVLVPSSQGKFKLERDV